MTSDRKISSLGAGTSKALQTTCCLTATVSPSSTPNRVPGAPGPTLPADLPVGARRAWCDPRSKPLSTAWPAAGAASVTRSTRSFFSLAEAMAPVPCASPSGISFACEGVQQFQEVLPRLEQGLRLRALRLTAVDAPASRCLVNPIELFRVDERRGRTVFSALRACLSRCRNLHQDQRQLTPCSRRPSACCSQSSDAFAQRRSMLQQRSIQ